MLKAKKNCSIKVN